MKTVLKKSNVIYLFVAQATLNFSSRGDSKEPAVKRSNDLLRRLLSCMKGPWDVTVLKQSLIYPRNILHCGDNVVVALETKGFKLAT